MLLNNKTLKISGFYYKGYEYMPFIIKTYCRVDLKGF